MAEDSASARGQSETWLRGARHPPAVPSGGNHRHSHRSSTARGASAWRTAPRSRCGSTSRASTARWRPPRCSRGAGATRSSSSATATASATPTTTAGGSASPRMLARAGYVVVVPQLAGIGGGRAPRWHAHPDLADARRRRRLGALGWEHPSVLMPPPPPAWSGTASARCSAARYAVEPSRRGIRRAERWVGGLVR